MTHKIVSTLILSGREEECKCEIYQHDTAEGPRFNACLYLRREVFMKLKNRGAVNLGSSDAPDSKPVLTWVQAKILNDINDITLEEVEDTIKNRYLTEPFFIPAFFDSRSSF